MFREVALKTGKFLGGGRKRLSALLAPSTNMSIHEAGEKKFSGRRLRYIYKNYILRQNVRLRNGEYSTFNFHIKFELERQSIKTR